ncbi:MAG: 50S ribosomal protein L11 methyltransferase [Verrucomicrobiota bacterium JB022]|nr:50S ribosomal protein L11 methyltransferase [Verrucomicrobiota bacterium JB022]
MIELRFPVSAEQANRLEEYFCEEYQTFWMLYENDKTKQNELRGFFASEEEAAEQQAALRSAVPSLPEPSEVRQLDDQDWKDAYKLHFKAWSDRGLHFVPVWERDTYPLPAGDQIVYLDPGMAFGTGNHETTRLCIRRLIDARDRWGDTVAQRNVIDAGCGSGILAISARKLGYQPVFGFDNDPESVRISIENAELCEVKDEVEFLWMELTEGLERGPADLVMANILANVLMAYADQLLATVKPGGDLALSGILAKEVDEVRAFFEAAAQKAWPEGAVYIDQRTENDWADVLLRRGE